jgi:hypothetical protein
MFTKILRDPLKRNPRLVGRDLTCPLRRPSFGFQSGVLSGLRAVILCCSKSQRQRDSFGRTHWPSYSTSTEGTFHRQWPSRITNANDWLRIHYLCLAGSTQRNLENIQSEVLTGTSIENKRFDTSRHKSPLALILVSSGIRNIDATLGAAKHTPVDSTSGGKANGNVIHGLQCAHATFSFGSAINLRSLEMTRFAFK